MRPTRAGNASAADLAAAGELSHNAAAVLNTARGRADKWVAGITGLAGVVGLVLVVKGPESVESIDTWWRAVVGGLLAVALGLLTWATYEAYCAAYGAPGPGSVTHIQPSPVEGLANRLHSARRIEARSSQTNLSRAVTATLFAIGTIAAAVAVSWFAPSAKSDTSKQERCVVMNGIVVARLAGGSLSVIETSTGTRIGACP